MNKNILGVYRLKRTLYSEIYSDYISDTNPKYEEPDYVLNLDYFIIGRKNSVWCLVKAEDYFEDKRDFTYLKVNENCKYIMYMKNKTCTYIVMENLPDLKWFEEME